MLCQIDFLKLRIGKQALDTDLALAFWRAVVSDPEWLQAGCGHLLSNRPRIMSSLSLKPQVMQSHAFWDLICSRNPASLPRIVVGTAFLCQSKAQDIRFQPVVVERCSTH